METVNATIENQIKEALKIFEKKREYFHETRHGKISLSEGCEYLKKTINAGWIFDQIVKFQTMPEMKNYKVQVWTWEQTKLRRIWRLNASTGNKQTLHAEFYSYVQFPLRSIQLWYLRGHLCLASEL
ncbi:MAG TPA: hypothetical protein VNW99_10990 [Cytophagaceae bacterium]|jgi:hypothetical protein|nr:hypothetical protein [Cytophagaceae bacterium]